MFSNIEDFYFCHLQLFERTSFKAQQMCDQTLCDQTQAFSKPYWEIHLSRFSSFRLQLCVKCSTYIALMWESGGLVIKLTAVPLLG